ncbi:MAG TPA: transporter substrate-binding domain-containing protein [Anaerovoracaceae bacterium]|nr:transporter substrate-binding domain-containing protein [Anaerovoracaceae bacterium]
MNKSKGPLMLILISIIFFTLPLISFAQEETVKVGWFPLDGFQEADEVGNYSGYNFEYLKKIEEYSNLKFELVEGSWSELMEALKDGEIDLMGNINKTEEREKDYLFSQYSMGESHITFITKQTDRRFTYDGLRDLDGFTICYGTGDYREKQIENLETKYDFKCKKIVAGSGTEIIENLDKGVCDAAVLDSAGCFSGYRIIGEYDSQPFFYITNIDNENLMDKIDDTMGKLKIAEPNLESDLLEEYYSGNNILAYTEEEKEYKANLEPLKVGLYVDSYLVSMCDDNSNKFEGITYEILERISEVSGLKFKYLSISDHENAIESLIEGKYDLITDVQRNIKNLNIDDIELTDGYLSNNIVLIGFENEINLDDDLIMNSYKVNEDIIEGIEEDYTSWDIIKNENSFKDLKSSDNEGIICSKYVADYYMQMPKYDGLKYIDVEFDIKDNCFAARSEDGELLSLIINKALLRMDDEEITEIINSYNLVNRYSMDGIDFIFEYSIILLLLLVLMITSIAILLKAKNTKLRKLQIEAMEANRSKSDFLSRMSHDMRTPLATVMGISSLGINEAKDEKDVKYYKQINSSSNYLLGLLNDILDMQRIDSDEIELAEDIFKLSDVVDQVLIIINVGANEKNIKVDFAKGNINLDKCYFGDSKRITQVFLNVLSNAIKYTRENGEVYWSFRMNYKDGKIILESIVKDNGVGISNEFQKIMFEPFTRENNPETKYEHGTGLGLAITYNLVKAMNGSINAKSTLGKGSQFIIKIPLGKITYDEEESHKLEGLNSNKVDLSGSRILLCEDVEINARIIKKMLEYKNIVVEIAENGKLGVEMVKNDSYDAILMDIKMPIMDGLEATKEIRNFNKNIPIIALSANAYKEDIEASIDAGMNEHLSKPVNEELLYKTLALFIKNS